MSKVLIHVQHLLGTGHVRRVHAIARALVDGGANVTVMTGGMAVPGLDWGEARLIQLPAVRAADVSFKTLLDEHGQAIDEAATQRHLPSSSWGRRLDANSQDGGRAWLVGILTNSTTTRVSDVGSR